MDYCRRPIIYDYDRRKVANSLAQQLTSFEGVVQAFAEKQGLTHTALTDRMDLYRLGFAVQGVFTDALKAGANLLFLAMLREYAMAPKDRRVIERAAKTFSKRQVNRIAPEKAIATYLKWLEELRLFAQTARSVLTGGSKHETNEEDSILKVGSFRLINTGGFGPAVMADVAKVVEKSEKLLRHKGLGKVCYGDFNVTNTVHQSTRVLAFYRPHDDTLYIRANLKGKQGPAVQSAVHELAHRLQFRFLKSKKQDIDAVYQTLKNKRNDARHAIIMDRSRWPKAGDTYMYKGETFVFDKVDLTRKSDLVAVFRLPGEKFALRMPLEEYVTSKHPDTGAEASVFVTNYAATDPDENFAEMVAFYCEDLLPDDQVAMLEAIL